VNSPNITIERLGPRYARGSNTRFFWVRCPFCDQLHVHAWVTNRPDPGLKNSTCGRGSYVVAGSGGVS
jgi:hypothetical protein